MPFIERIPLEQGFSDVHDAEVMPVLQELELERQARERKTWIRSGLIVAGGIAFAILVTFLFGPRLAGAAVLIAVVMAGTSIWSEWSTGEARFRDTLADALMPIVCGHLGAMKYSADGSAFSLDEMVELQIVPTHEKAWQSSLLEGTHQGTDFQIVHAGLTTRIDGGNTQVFEGLLFRITLNKPAPGRIGLMRDRGGLVNKLAETFAGEATRSWPRVIFDEDAAFENAFAVYADEPDAARDYLDGPFRAALLEVADLAGGDKGAESLLAGFDGPHFYMALERKGGFIQMGSLTTDATNIRKCLHGVFDDLAMAQAVVERIGAR